MDAIHINWTKPFTDKTGLQYETEDFELLTTALSALNWQKHNGKISMITDSAGYEFYEKNGLLPLWDNGVKKTLDDIPGINSDMFWAAGKLWALKNSSAPVAMIDTDFIVWAPIAFDNLADAAVIHEEDLYPDVYPDISHFKMKDGYEFDAEWDFSLRACNTAFAVIKNQELLEYYTSEAIKFMQSAEDTGDPLTYMVFAEQRLLPLCAKKLGLQITVVSNLERLFNDGERYFTHTWGMKQQMRDMPELRYDFCMRCAARIQREFPDWADILGKIDCLKPYFKNE